MNGVDVATRLLDSFNAHDLDDMQALLAPDLVAFVTNAARGMDRVVGREEYLRRVEAMDLPSANYTVTLTQDPVVIADDLVLLMVEIQAARAGRTLHNFAAHVLRVDDGVVTEWRMADVKPRGERPVLVLTWPPLAAPPRRVNDALGRRGAGPDHLG